MVCLIHEWKVSEGLLPDVDAIVAAFLPQDLSSQQLHSGEDGHMAQWPVYLLGIALSHPLSWPCAMPIRFQKLFA